jgi:hypothetical protein
MGALKRKILPARGGKRMAIKPRKRSGEHILNSSMYFGLHG